MNEINSDTLQTWVGHEQRIGDALSPFPARALAAALDLRRLPEVGEPLPPLWHWIYFLETPSGSATAVDGHPRKGEFLPPVPLPRRMWAAGSLHVTEQLQIGTAAEKVSTIRSVEHKEGKTGPLVFVTIDHRIYQETRLCISEEQTLVYRAMPKGPAPLTPGDPAPPVAHWSRQVQPDPVLLFRFSALTYNAHRIHYDRDYAIREEFYPGLVVHAPLLATLLIDLIIRERPDALLSRFRFRAVRPTFDLGPVQLRGQSDGRSVKLWSVDHENFVGMDASAVLADAP